MKTLLLTSIILLSNIIFSQKLFVKNADLVVEAETSAEQASVLINSKKLDIIYIDNQPETLSKGDLQIGSLETEHIHLQDLINKYGNEHIGIELSLLTNQFQNQSNLESSFNSVINVNINNVTKEIPVTVIISNSKTPQSNLYLISVQGTLSLDDFDIEINFLKNIIDFSYRQNIQVKS